MIGVIGCGSWGTALAAVLARKNLQHIVTIWGRDHSVLTQINQEHLNVKFTGQNLLPVNLQATDDLRKLLAQHLDILISIPSKAFTELFTDILPLLTPQHRLVWATKGLEKNSGRFLHQVVLEALPQCAIAVLSGPSFAEEVVKNIPTAVSLASNNNKFLHDLLAAFQQDTFRVYPTSDLLGVQLGGVMKNIFAVAAGVGDGLGFGANTRAALLTRALSEMQRLALKLGAEADTMIGLAGLGDLILSCTDNKSRNRRFGLCLAQGMSTVQAESQIGVVEALDNVREVFKLASLHKIDMPITFAVHELLLNKISAQQAAQNLLARKSPTVEILD